MLSKREMASYGLGAVGKDMVYMFSASYILYYYQDILGVSAIAMGMILMAARVFDAFNDPVMGVIVAKTRTRFGKFRGNGAQCHRVVSDVCGTACIGRRRAGSLCGGYIHFMGCDLYHDGYSVLVHDSGIYAGRKGT